MKDKQEVVVDLINQYEALGKNLTKAIDIINIQADKIKCTKQAIAGEIDQIMSVHSAYTADDVIRILHRIEKA